jgi:hypothetical protein
MTPQEKQVFSKLFPKTELGTHKVDLAAIDDIEKILDSALAKQRQLISQGLKVSEQLLSLTADYNKALGLSIDAANKAKDLGIPEAEKLFRVRADEAKDYSGVLGKVSNQIDSALRSI